VVIVAVIADTLLILVSVGLEPSGSGADAKPRFGGLV